MRSCEIVVVERALTLHQPYATAVRDRIKHCETRSWFTHFRGYIAIHASKKKLAGYALLDSLPTGALLCTAYLEDVVPITQELIEQITEQEYNWGDWTLGRYAWKLRDVVPFEKPIPMRGRQGLWKLDEPLKLHRGPIRWIESSHDFES